MGERRGAVRGESGWCQVSAEKPDLSDVMRSPYDDVEPASEGDSEIPWKPPVIAAIIGALLVSALVIYAIVAGPNDEPGDVTSGRTETEAVRSTDVPPGFTALPSGNGARIEAATSSDTLYVVGVSFAVAGSEAPSEVAPDQIAYWELRSDADAIVMTEQLSEIGILGNTTVVFGVGEVPGEPQLAAYPIADVVERTDEIEVPSDDIPGGVGFSIDVEPGVSVDGVVTIGDGWGHVDWSLEGGVTAKLDTVVTFVGTDDPGTEGIDETQLIPGHLRTLSQGLGAVEAAPLHGFSGSDQLDRVGEPLSSTNEPTAIVIEFDAEVVVAVSDSVAVGFPPSG